MLYWRLRILFCFGSHGALANLVYNPRWSTSDCPILATTASPFDKILNEGNPAQVLQESLTRKIKCRNDPTMNVFGLLDHLEHVLISVPDLQDVVLHRVDVVVEDLVVLVVPVHVIFRYLGFAALVCNIPRGSTTWDNITFNDMTSSNWTWGNVTGGDTMCGITGWGNRGSGDEIRTAVWPQSWNSLRT